MSVKHGLLALLERGPMHGYQLRAAFEESTGGTWPLNIGQVYTTLDRLERDGLVRNDGGDGDGHVIYSITAAGRTEVSAWFAAPVPRANPPRNELAIKLALGLTIPGTDVGAIIQAQRAVSIRALQEYTKSRRDTAALQRPADTARLLVLDSLIFQTEAEVRWLDLCEARLMQLSNLQG
jgi:DNA-binding PadR family transcriptional regulator